MRIYDHAILDVVIYEDPLAVARLEACQVVLLLLELRCRIVPYAGPGNACGQSVEYADDWDR